MQRAVELINPRLKGTHFEQRIKRLGHKFINSKDFLEFYTNIVTNSNPETTIKGTPLNINTAFENIAIMSGELSEAEKMMCLDTLTYLCDDICVKVDRAAMSQSLEVRAPFLNHKLVEHAWSIPIENKIGNGQGKLILKSLLKLYLPENLVTLPKKGFSVPLENWLRYDLRDWAQKMIDDAQYELIGSNHKTVVEKLWQEHLNNNKDYSSQIWAYLMLFGWLSEYRNFIN